MNMKNATLLKSSLLRRRSVIAQRSTPAPIDNIVNDDETKRLRNRTSLGLSRITRRDCIAKCRKLNTQNKINMKNATLSKSSLLRRRSVIAQRSTPAPIDNVVNDDDDDEIERSRSRSYRKLRLLGLSRITRRDGIAKRIKLKSQNKINIENAVSLCIDDFMEYLVKNRNEGSSNNNNDNDKGIMETLNDKSDKINHQHYNYYGKNIIIDYVNDDCLAEIFMYVPVCERPKIALVCKKWKEVLNDSWFNVKKLELTYWKYHELPYCLKKYQTVDGKLNFLKSLLDKCGRYLRTLDLTAYGHCNIVPIINDYCPNLQKLRLRFTCIQNAMLFNAFTRLSKLKSLTILFQNMKGKSIPLTLINSLKNVADTLTELNLLNFVNHLDDSCDYPKEFNSVIRELKVMKNFEVAGIRGFENLFEYFKKNNEMSFYFNHDEYLRKSYHLGFSFIYIKSLDLKSCYVKDNTLYTIANTIKRLEFLHISCKWITDDGVVALSKMNNLTDIIFDGYSNITDSSIKLLKNIEKICLPQSNKITDASLTKLVENSPKIDYLYLQDTSVTAEFIKKVADMAMNRKRRLMVSISFIPDIKQYTSKYFKIFPI